MVVGIIVVWNLYTWSLANDENHSLIENFTQVFFKKNLKNIAKCVEVVYLLINGLSFYTHGDNSCYHGFS